MFRATDRAFFLRSTNDSGTATDVVVLDGVVGNDLLPVAGDWDGDGDDGIGVFVRETSTFFLRNEASTGSADHVFSFGDPRDLPVVGDWDGDGVDTVGVFRPSRATFFIRNTAAGGTAEGSALFGEPGTAWLPLAGDWDGDGRDGIGLYDGSTGRFALRQTVSDGIADIDFMLVGGALGRPLAGRW